MPYVKCIPGGWDGRSVVRTETKGRLTPTVPKTGDPICCNKPMKRSEMRSGHPWWCSQCGEYLTREDAEELRRGEPKTDPAPPKDTSRLKAIARDFTARPYPSIFQREWDADPDPSIDHRTSTHTFARCGVGSVVLLHTAPLTDDEATEFAHENLAAAIHYAGHVRVKELP